MRSPSWAGTPALLLTCVLPQSNLEDRVPRKQRPQWQPINRLPLITTAIDGMLETTQERLENLENDTYLRFHATHLLKYGSSGSTRGL